MLATKKIINVLFYVYREHVFAVTAASGFLAGSVFSYGTPALLLPLILLPLLYRFYNPHLQTNDLKSELLVFITFFVSFFAIVLLWFFDTNSSAIAGISDNVTLIAQVVSWVIMTCVMTVFMLPLAFLAHRVRKWQLKNVHLILVVASGWVVLEWVRSVGFSLFLYGESGTVGDYWNFGSLGLAFMSTPFAFLSRLVGMYGLSFLVIVLACILYISIRTKYLLPIVVTALATSVLSLFGHFLPTGNSQVLRPASLLQQDTSQDFQPAVPVKNRLQQPKDLIVLPEYSSFFNGGFNEIGEHHVSNRLSKEGFSIDVNQSGPTQRYGTLKFRNHKSELIGEQTKEMLIPTGEYLPAVLTTFFNVTQQSAVIENFDSSRRLYKGDPPETFTHKNLTVGPVACSGILGRGIYRQHALDGAEVFTNSASLVVFNQSRAYFRQSLQMARFHAVANARTYVQASKGAPSFVINKDGNFIVEPAEISSSFIDFEFKPETSLTPYTVLGEWVLFISGVGLLIVLVFRSIRKRFLP